MSARPVLPPDPEAVREPGDGHGSMWQLGEHPVVTLARNVSTRYVLIVVNVLIGIVMLRYNVQHLGKEAYGLWMLVASVSAYFTVLDLGYGSAVVRFVAEFRARRDARALNEILSTMAYVYSAIGLVSYGLAVVLAMVMPRVFNLAPGQELTGRLVLLMIALQVALYFRFVIYGGVINGFERYYVNNVVGLVFNIATAAVNVLVIWLGYGLVELVAATTTMRILPFWVYRRNAYAVFPQLQIRRELFRRDRLRELTGFSIYVAIVDWAGRIMYATDTFYLGVFVNVAAVALYSVAQRIADTLLTLTHQLHTFMMPVVLHRALDSEVGPQRSLMIRTTRFQLAIAMCLCGGVISLAGGLIAAWLGPGWEDSVLATQLLALVVVVRASVAMPTTVLQGTGHERYVAIAFSVGAAANVLLSVPLVIRWNVMGVALGTLIASVICAVMIFPKTCRLLDLGVWAGYRQVVLPTVWPAAIVMVFNSALHEALPPGFVTAVAALAGGGLLYAALFLMFGLDREERQWFAGALQRITGRSRLLAAGDVVG